MLTPTYGVSNPSLSGWVGQVAGRDLDERRSVMDNYSVTYVFDFCVVTATCYADEPESAPDLAWDWVRESLGGVDRSAAIEVSVTPIGEEA